MATKKKVPKKKTAADPQVLRWKKDGLSLRVSQHQWIIADWILRGMKLFKSKTKAYDEAVKLTGMTRETLQQFKMTAEFFPASTRVKDLSFGIHRLVAKEKYTPEQRARHLLYAKEAKETVEGFAGYLRGLDDDVKRRADKRPPADKAADALIEGCTGFLRNHNFGKLLNKPPSTAKRTTVLDELRKVVAAIDAKAEMLATTWRKYDATQQDKKAKGVGAGK
jgi:hypothetical protein